VEDLRTDDNIKWALQKYESLARIDESVSGYEWLSHANKVIIFFIIINYVEFFDWPRKY
jgi:hypothetical protein